MTIVFIYFQRSFMFMEQSNTNLRTQNVKSGFFTKDAGFYKTFFKWWLSLPSARWLRCDYRKVVVPIMLSQVLWGVSVPMQTAILGHLSADAIAEYSNAIVHAFQKFRAPFSGKIVHIFPEQSAVIWLVLIWNSYPMFYKKVSAK